MSTVANTGITTYTPNPGSNAGGQATGSGSSLGKDSFLKLLVTQLSNQSPDNPVDSSQMLAQMAQFSTLEQMQNLNTTLTSQTALQQMSTAAGMIGHTITSTILDKAGNAINGKVSAVTVSNGIIEVMLGNTPVPLNSITTVSS